jgi:DNA processing protein
MGKKQKLATIAAPPLPQSDDEILDWLQLSRSENVGPLTVHRLLAKYATPQKALEALPALATRGGLKRPLKVIPRSEAEKELTLTRRFGAEVLHYNSPLYPPLLRHIESAPPIITAKGRLELLKNPTFAIVGARNASAMGKKMAYQLAHALGQGGWMVASGLARGIDTAAHQGSLETGTIAALAGGIDQIYPQENHALYEQIAKEGVLLAESPFGVQPQATLFPRRNRIISGISRCVLVVEAALKSGSLITTRYALEQGRDVLAVPGHPMDPRARGCNQLIKNGAILVEAIEDIEREILFASPPHLGEKAETFLTESPSSCLVSARTLIKENLGYVPISVDELIRECQLSPTDTWIVLLEMEIAGCLERLPGGKVSLREEWKNI